MTIPDAFELALQHHRAGRLTDAEALYRQILAARPNHADSLHLLGVIAHQVERNDLAVDWIRQAIAMNPTGLPYYVNIGAALAALGRLDEAIAGYRHTIQIQPDYAEAHHNLGNALRAQGQFDEALAEFRRALEIKPDFADTHNNLGNVLKDLGELNESIAAFRQANRLSPEDARFHSNLVYALHFEPGHTANSISEEHQRWNRRFSEPWKPSVLPRSNDRRPERRLKIGYVSPDFWDHPVGRHVLPLFENHDRDQFDILCYAGVERPDWITQRFRTLAANSSPGSGWRNTLGVPDARLAEMIREDGVDILVDLAMHTGGNRLPVFARQPAPVQATWLAYPGSTGLPSIAYRLTDAHIDPPEAALECSPEKPVRLPDSWCCYAQADASPAVNELPASSTDCVTFGSLNNFAKMNEGVLALWAELLKATQGSRLLMLCPEGRTRERVREFLSARGLATERVELVGKLPRQEYLKLYHRIDIGLDPFPCNGMTTTCDALWMGVPVLTLPGATPISRAGLSLLSSIGLSEFVASSEDDYIRIAVELAGNLPSLAELRAELRPRMQSSPLMDAPRFARNVEAAFRSIWERWSRGQTSIREEA